MSILNPSGRPPILGDVTAFDCTLTDSGWPWAAGNAAAIAAHWDEVKAANPALFNGKVIIATEVGIEKSHLVSSHVVTDFAALTYWRYLGFPRADAFNLFGAGVVVTSDGAVLLGRMAAHTANAGFVYFPCGTPDLDDVTADGSLDIDGSILRELQEETGLEPRHLTPSAKRWISWDGPLFCCARRIDTPLTAGEVLSVCRRRITFDASSELEDVVLVRSTGDLAGLNIPAYAVAIIGDVLGD